MSEGTSAQGEERRRYEQTLMRIGRRLEALGQLLVQDPARVIGKGFSADPGVTGQRPIEIDMDELRGLFDRAQADNIGQLLSAYHSTVAEGRQKGPA